MRNLVNVDHTLRITEFRIPMRGYEKPTLYLKKDSQTGSESP